MKAELFAFQITFGANHPTNTPGREVVMWAGHRSHEFVMQRERARLEDAAFWLRHARWPEFQDRGIRAELVAAERIGR